MKLEELKKKLKGVIIVNTTSFNKDGSLDLTGFRANLRWLLKRTEGKDFIFNPLGSTGEFYAMSDDECKAVIKTTVEEVNGKLPVFAGVGRPGTKETIKMCQYAESVGVNGVQVILPYYFIPTEEGAYLHYKKIADSIKIAVMVYNNPAPTGCWIKPPLMAKIAKIDNVIACKENTKAFSAEWNIYTPPPLRTKSAKSLFTASGQSGFGCTPARRPFCAPSLQF